jgi:L-methionine (R)-S-oxide reductase
MDKQNLYEMMALQAQGLVEGKQHSVSIYANIAALIKSTLPYVSWVGFYLFDGEALYLGPFQGLVACVDIPLSKGVCGQAARTKSTVIVDDVHAFPGHIACDAGSQSEIVVPILKHGQLLGVLDLDSYHHAAFDNVDQVHLESLMALLVNVL